MIVTAITKVSKGNQCLCKMRQVTKKETYIFKQCEYFQSQTVEVFIDFLIALSPSPCEKNNMSYNCIFQQQIIQISIPIKANATMQGQNFQHFLFHFDGNTCKVIITVRN
jgi:hypothetical protein